MFEESTEIVALLRPDYTLDYWADEVEPQLARRLEALDDEEWARLTAAVAEEPAGPRARLAEALRHTTSRRATMLLVDLLRAPEPEVGAAAADSLLELHHTWLPGVSLSGEIDRHLASAPPELQPRLERLRARLPD